MHESTNRTPNDERVGGSVDPQGGAVHAGGAAKKASGAERRRHERREIVDRHIVPIQLGSNNGGLVVDLSTGGAAVVSVAPLERSSKSSFALQIGDTNSQIEGTGVFVWVDSTGLNAGLRFDRLSPQARRSLDQWLSRPAEITEEPVPPNDAATEPTVAVTQAAAVVERTAFSDKLQRLVERAQLVASADGACVALKSTEGFRCEASVGNAPDVGLPVSQERGLAAECIAGRHLVVCNDVAADPRVNAATRQHLDFGSAIVLPLGRGPELTGILGVFSQRRDAFGEQAIPLLQETARLIENTMPEPARAGSKPRSRRASDQSSQTSGNAGGASHRRRGISVVRIFVTTLLVTFSLLGLWYVYQLRPATELSQPAPSAAHSSELPHAQTTAPPANPARTEPTRVVTPTALKLPAPAAAASTTAGARRAVEESVRQKSLVPVEVPAAQTITAPSQPAAPVHTSVPQPQRNSLQATVVSPATAPVPATVKPQPSPPVPHVQVLSELLQPKAAANDSTPELISKAPISFPAAAVAAHRQGSVILKVTVDPSGTVRGIEVLDGDEVLAAEAVRSVHQWRYKPYQAGGRDVGIQLLLTINFIMSSQELR
ncbi:MAG: TonB family protein [Terriglobales bacterium]